MKILLYLLFVFFSTRGILIYYEIIPISVDFLLNAFFKGIFICWFVWILFKKTHYKKYYINNGIYLLIFIFIFSSLVNTVSFEKFFRFVFNVFYPIAVFYYVVNFLNKKDIDKLFGFIVFYYLIQFLYSIIDNYSTFASGTIIIDDAFWGFYGFPRAYPFSFATAILSIFFLIDLLTIKNYYSLILFLPLSLVQILAGAGRIFIIYIFVIAIALLFSSKLRLKNIFFSIIIGAGIIFISNFYFLNMSNFRSSVSDINKIEIPKNPKIFYFLKSITPIINDNAAFLFGFGPGNYMSWTSMAFNPLLVKKYNDDLHEKFSTDAYQAFNNVVGFWGDIGIIGLLIYYGIIIKIFLDTLKIKTSNNLQIKKYKRITIFIIIFGIIESTLVQVFDDAYYSLAFWLFLGLSFAKLRFAKNCN